jgi:hypothetical protein
MKKVSGETTLDALQRAYLQTQLRAKALRICEELDRGCNHAAAKLKQDALVLARYYINRAR